MGTDADLFTLAQRVATGPGPKPRLYLCCGTEDDLLADNPSLARSVFNRFPYLEPLNHLQVELLRRYRSGDDDELVQRGILLTMSGLATALRNSG